MLIKREAAIRRRLPKHIIAADGDLMWHIFDKGQQIRYLR
jgi:hypothetical protein